MQLVKIMVQNVSMTKENANNMFSLKKYKAESDTKHTLSCRLRMCTPKEGPRKTCCHANSTEYLCMRKRPTGDSLSLHLHVPNVLRYANITLTE